MTVSTFAFHAPEASSEYRPGVCNIGPAEISRRRRAGHVALIATAVVFAVLLLIGAPPLTRLVLILPAAASASGYLQAWFKFCAGFGSRGIFNFGDVGTTERVANDAARALDRARSRRIGLASLAIGIVVAVLAVLLAVVGI